MLMEKMKVKIWLSSLVAALLLLVPVQAQMGSHLKEQFQDAEKHGIRIIGRVSEIRGAIHDPSVKMLCLQSFGEALPVEAQAELLEWVRSGRTVWFYDARLAPQFGMKAYFLEPEQFRGKPESGVLGNSKRAGMAAVGVSHGLHAIQTGVGQVTVFLPEIEPEKKGGSKLYGAVEVAGDTVALLQFAPDSPAVMALRRDGRGLIVFKALLWNEPLSGDRFQANILDYSAGFQVPGPAGEGKVGRPPGPEAEYVTGQPAVPLAESAEVPAASNPTSVAVVPPSQGQGKVAKGWSLELKDGTIVQGELQADVLQFETGTGSLKLKPTEVTRLEFGSSIKLDKVTTVSGKTQSGLLMSTPLKFRTERGVEVFEKEDLQVLHRSEIP